MALSAPLLGSSSPGNLVFSAPNCSALSEDFSLAFAKSLLSADQQMSCGETGVRLKSLWPTVTTRGSAGVCLSKQ